MIIFTTGRPTMFRKMTVGSLKHYGIPYDALIMDLPSGPRILVNDNKPPKDPDGLNGSRREKIGAHAISVERNGGLNWEEMKPEDIYE